MVVNGVALNVVKDVTGLQHSVLFLNVLKCGTC
jgi:hypothetical protein